MRYRVSWFFTTWAWSLTQPMCPAIRMSRPEVQRESCIFPTREAPQTGAKPSVRQ